MTKTKKEQSGKVFIQDDEIREEQLGRLHAALRKRFRPAFDHFSTAIFIGFLNEFHDNEVAQFNLDAAAIEAGHDSHLAMLEHNENEAAKLRTYTVPWDKENLRSCGYQDAAHAKKEFHFSHTIGFENAEQMYIARDKAEMEEEKSKL